MDFAVEGAHDDDEYIYDLKAVVFHIGEDSTSGHCMTL